MRGVERGGGARDISTEFDDGSARGRYFAAFAPRSVGGLTFTPRDTIDSEEKHLPRRVTFVFL